MYSRIDPGVCKVDKNIHQHNYRGDNEVYSGYNRVISTSYCIHHQTANTGQLEELLND